MKSFEIKTTRGNDSLSEKVQRTLAHNVRRSPWPILTALSLGSLLFCSASFFQECNYGLLGIFISLSILLLSMFSWFTDITFEAFIEGQHTTLVQRALKTGMILFIVSEVLFFVSFFWAFFHFSLAPSSFIFCVWPPKGITIINPWGIPLLNTIILLTSGVFLTASHRALLGGWYITAFRYLLGTILLGLIFTCYQVYEYIHCPFSINDSVYGSIFFMATGFHGLHVLVGTIFLIVCLFRVEKQLSSSRHLGFECAAYYWHFVDVVWLFLFISVYWWGS